MKQRRETDERYPTPSATVRPCPGGELRDIRDSRRLPWRSMSSPNVIGCHVTRLGGRHALAAPRVDPQGMRLLWDTYGSTCTHSSRNHRFTPVRALPRFLRDAVCRPPAPVCRP